MILGRVLFASPSQQSLAELSAALQSKGFDVEWCGSSEGVVARVEGGDIDVVIAADEVVDATGIELCERVVKVRPDVRVILVGEVGHYEGVLAALRAGAFDFFTKPVSIEAIELLMHRALRQRRLDHEVKRLRMALAEATGFEELIGVSHPMQRLYDLLERAAQTSASVLVTGESGTGKELVARALHRRSKRAGGPFVAVNCSAIPEHLLESELFGHVKGAFTDAKAARSGLFVKASGGTIFLDEIGDMPLSLQPKLLRTLQERVVRPVGGERELSVDVRVVAATNHDLESAVSDKLFREDLYYRLNVIHLAVPPLRERSSDILLIAQHFVEHFARFSDKEVVGLAPAAADTILAYAWPGNVRELQNCIERAVAMTRHREVQREDLPEKIRDYRRAHVLVAADRPSELVTMDEVERRYIIRVLQAVRGNKREAARVLGFDRKTLYRKLERYGIQVDKEESGPVVH
ncbi:sigma-54-dependent transcriptional regulator [Haliangium sp.]|uniref:sigma-54-dependent transcriptional regulator n=1 Tax=Haliangium sp. TaxID=2663208 RepID=UPI003D0C6DA6